MLAGEISIVGGLKIAGIPGVYSDKFYDKPYEASFEHLTRAHIDMMLALTEGIDILVMHQAPAGVGLGEGGADPGNRFLTSVIEYLQPKLVLFGHRNRYFQGNINVYT